jgi:hypothetical protein
MLGLDERRKAETRRIREIFMPELVLRLHQELMASRHIFPGYVTQPKRLGVTAFVLGL